MSVYHRLLHPGYLPNWETPANEQKAVIAGNGDDIIPNALLQVSCSSRRIDGIAM